MVLQEACEAVSTTVGVGESMEPLEDSLRGFLVSLKSIVDDEITFSRGLRSNQVVEESQILRFLFDGSGENRELFAELLTTGTGERVVLSLRSHYSPSETGPLTSLEAIVGFEGFGADPLIPIVWRAKLSDYSAFMAEMSKRPVLDSRLTRKQQEMASSLVRSRLAHAFGVRSNLKNYGLTLAGKAVRIAIKWRFISFPVALAFAVLVILSNVNSTIDLVCRLFDYQ